MQIRSIDRASVARAVHAYAAELRRDHPEIRRVIGFGSWVSGRPSPGSDVDICVIVADTLASVPQRERVARYLRPALPVGVDLVVYTESEFRRLPERSRAWHATIKAGVDLWPRCSADRFIR